MTIESVNYSDLLAQRAELDNKIKAAQAARRTEGLAIIRETMREYDLSLEDLGVRGAQARNSKVPSKYRDPESGKEWSGRGKPPAWIAGKDRTAFLIS